MQPVKRSVVKLGLMVLAALTASAGYGDGREVVAGFWASDGSIIQIELNGESLQATVRAMKDPLYREDETGLPVGTPRLDDKNSDTSLQSRPVLGMQILSGYAFDGKRWKGKIYDPESGNTYSSNMKLDGERLKMRGYIGVPMFGRTQVFDPVASCTAGIREMVQLAKLTAVGCD